MSASLLANPLVQVLAAPLIVAFFAAGVIRLLAGSGRGAVLAAAGAALGFLAAYVLILGLPPLPPRSATQKLAVLVAAGLALGIVLDLVGRGRPVMWIAALAWPTLGLAWLGEARLRAPTVDALVLLGVLWLGSLAVAWRAGQLAARGIDGAVVLVVAALTLGIVALIGASASYAQLCFALAAATGGFLLWNWPVARWRWAAAGLLGAGAALIFMAQALALFSRADRIALAVIGLSFFADSAVGRFLPASGALRPIAIAVCAAVPAAIAHFRGDGGGY